MTLFPKKKHPSKEKDQVTDTTKLLEESLNKISQLDQLKLKYLKGQEKITTFSNEIEKTQHAIADEEISIKAATIANIIRNKAKAAFHDWRITDKQLDIACNQIYNQILKLQEQIANYHSPQKANEKNAIAVNLLARIEQFEMLLDRVKENIQKELKRIDNALQTNQQHKATLISKTSIKQNHRNF